MQKDVALSLLFCVTLVSCQPEYDPNEAFELDFDNAQETQVLHTRCPECYNCLFNTTGQNVPEHCMEGDINEILSCAAQIKYMYDRNDTDEIFEDSTFTPFDPETTALPPTTGGPPGVWPPCFKECRVCIDDLDTLGYQVSRPSKSVWDQWYPQFFVRTDDPDTMDNIITDDEPGRRRKRELDLDACCDTDRTSYVYKTTFTDSNNNIWYPVWFYRPSEPSPFKYSVQVADIISCPSPTASCDSALSCQEQNIRRTFLFTRYEPDPVLGHFLIVLTYPNVNNTFVDIDIPSYCKCTYST